MEENLFTKEQLVESERFRHERDILNTILSGGGYYSLEEVEEKINEFLEREAK